LHTIHHIKLIKPSLNTHFNLTILKFNYKNFLSKKKNAIRIKVKISNLTLPIYHLWSTDTSQINHVPMSDTYRVQHRHDTDTYNYTELRDFLKFLSVLACPCRVQCPYRCFILYHFHSNIFKFIKKNPNSKQKKTLNSTPLQPIHHIKLTKPSLNTHSH